MTCTYHFLLSQRDSTWCTLHRKFCATLQAHRPLAEVNNLLRPRWCKMVFNASIQPKWTLAWSDWSRWALVSVYQTLYSVSTISFTIILTTFPRATGHLSIMNSTTPPSEFLARMASNSHISMNMTSRLIEIRRFVSMMIIFV